MPSPKRRFGDIGESIAQKYLEGKGYLIVDRNYRKPYGEIDLVAQKDNLLIFIEVKTRDIKHAQYFLPEQSVNKSKSKKIRKVCEIYLLEKHYSPNQEWQIDIITVSVNKESEKAQVKHMENAVWEKQY